MFSKSTTAILWIVAIVFASLLAFDAIAGTSLLTAGAGGMLIAPVAASTLPEAIKAQLDRIHDQAVEPVRELGARLQSVEQVLAKIGMEGMHPTSGHDSPGEQAVQALTNPDRGDYQFQQAVEAAAQNKKLPVFSSRVTIEGSIRAALTNDGKGNTGDTSVPSDPERRGMVGPVFRQLRLLNVLPSRPTSSDAVEFVQLISDGDDATEQVHEGDAKGELEMHGELARAEIATIAGWVEASRQVLGDHPALSQMINNVIRNRVLSRLEHQLINGTGAPGYIHGLLPQATTFTPTIGTTPADIIGESLVRQANRGYRPNLVLLNPLDWFRLQITRKNETDDEYVFGSPTSPLPPALWNQPIVTTPSVPEGTGMTIDTSFTTVLDRQQMTIVVGLKNDQLIRNLVTILGELRAGLEVLDQAAVNKFSLTPVGP